MVGVKDLDGVETRRGERAHQRFRVPVPHGVREGRDAAGLPDRLQDVGRLPLRGGHVPRVFAAEEAVERVVVGGGVAGQDEGAREVRPSPDAVAHVAADGVEIQPVARGDQLLGHRLPAAPPDLLSLWPQRRLVFYGAGFDHGR